jgi:hypothetical protein
MDVTHHLHEDSEMRAGTASDGDPAWVSVVVDGCDVTFFGEVDQLIEVGKLFLSQALRLRDASARELLEAAE